MFNHFCLFFFGLKYYILIRRTSLIIALTCLRDKKLYTGGTASYKPRMFVSSKTLQTAVRVTTEGNKYSTTILSAEPFIELEMLLMKITSKTQLLSGINQRLLKE